MADSVIQLKCDCTNYAWGKLGRESRAARYCSQTPGTDFKIDDGKPYAEMWFGTYPTLPARVLSSGENLQDVLNAKKEELIRKPVLEKFGTDLPFLPKVLSIAKAHPLQLHPDKDLAARLHEKDPSKFGDTNHKPEIAVALSDFEAFVGFKPLQDIQGLLGLKPLQRFLPSPPAHFNPETLKHVCADMLTTSETTVAETVKALSALRREAFRQHRYILDLLPRIESQYSAADNGILVALICMNYVKLSPGEAIWVPADGIHAWFAGDIIECMARSDNVLNTGFCPRADRDDVATFTSALTFCPRGVDEAILEVKSKSDKSVDGKTRSYEPPMSEFNVMCTELKGGDVETVKKLNGPSTMVVTGGLGKMVEGDNKHDLGEGTTWFIGQGVEVGFEAGEDGLIVYRAYAERF